jgi:hypothetical protein
MRGSLFSKKAHLAGPSRAAIISAVRRLTAIVLLSIAADCLILAVVSYASNLEIEFASWTDGFWTYAIFAFHGNFGFEKRFADIGHGLTIPLPLLAAIPVGLAVFMLRRRKKPNGTGFPVQP